MRMFPRRWTEEGEFFIGVGCPNHPGNDGGGLHTSGCPQGTRESNGTVSPHATKHSSDEQQNGSGNPPVPLNIVEREQILVGEEVAVVAGEDHAGQTTILQDARGDGLSAGLKSHGSQWDEQLPAQAIFAVRFVMAKGDYQGSGDNEEQLDDVGDDEHPAYAWTKVAVEATEEERSEAECGDGGEGLDPAYVSSGSDKT